MAIILNVSVVQSFALETILTNHAMVLAGKEAAFVAPRALIHALLNAPMPESAHLAKTIS